MRRCLAQRAQIARGAARGIGVYGEDSHDLALAVGAQRLLNRIRVDWIAFAPGCAYDTAPQRLRLDRPRLGEMPGPGNQHGLTRRDQILDRRFPCAVAVRGEHEQLGVVGMQQLLQSALDRGDRPIEPRVAVIHRLAVHRIEHRVGNVRRSG